MLAINGIKNGEKKELKTKYGKSWQYRGFNTSCNHENCSLVALTLLTHQKQHITRVMPFEKMSFYIEHLTQYANRLSFPTVYGSTIKP